MLKKLSYFSKKFGINQRTLQRKIKQGQIPAKRLGRILLADEADIERYLNPKRIDIELGKFISDKNSEMISFLTNLISKQSESCSRPEENFQFLKTVYDFLLKNGINCALIGKGSSSLIFGSIGFGREAILFNATSDTAPAGDIEKWSFDPYIGVIKDKKLFGRGVGDSKGGLVAMIFALIFFNKFADLNKFKINFIFNNGEHNGDFFEVEKLLKKGLLSDSKSAIIGYATNWSEIHIGARGYHRYKIITEGKSVHTGSRFKIGINAIEKMAQLISKIKEKPLKNVFSKIFPLNSKLTISQISGGTAINIVPDRCEIAIDIRTTPLISKSYLDSFLEEIINELKDKDKEFKAKIQYITGQEAFLIDKNNILIKSLLNVLEKYKIKTELTISGPAHTGNLFAKYGISSIIWGPKGDNFHMPDEFVEIDSIAKTVQIYVETVIKYFENRKTF